MKQNKLLFLLPLAIILILPMILASTEKGNTSAANALVQSITTSYTFPLNTISGSNTFNVSVNATFATALLTSSDHCFFILYQTGYTGNGTLINSTASPASAAGISQCSATFDSTLVSDGRNYILNVSIYNDSSGSVYVNSTQVLTSLLVDNTAPTVRISSDFLTIPAQSENQIYCTATTDSVALVGEMNVSINLTKPSASGNLGNVTSYNTWQHSFSDGDTDESPGTYTASCWVNDTAGNIGMAKLTFDTGAQTAGQQKVATAKAAAQTGKVIAPTKEGISVIIIIIFVFLVIAYWAFFMTKKKRK